MRSITYVTVAICLLVVSPRLFSQVGIGNTSPKSTLDIVASDQANPSSKDGILIPRIDQFPSTTPGPDQDGMMVFLTTDTGSYTKGLHYWDNDLKLWRGIYGEWEDGVNGSGDDLIYSKQAKANGVDFVFTDDGWIGLGTDDPVERFELKSPGDNDLQLTSANTNPPNFILYNTGGTIENPDALATDQEIGAIVIKTHDGVGIRENGGFRFYMDGTPSAGSVPSRFVISTTPEGSVGQRERLVVRATGNVGLSETDPTATLHIRSGSATAGSAPVKLTAGTNLTTPENGAVEYDGSNLYFTENNSRQVVMKGYAAKQAINFPSVSAGDFSEMTATVNGATTDNACNCNPEGSIEAGLMWNCFVSANDTVTIRMYNASGSSINPANKNWSITVLNY